MEKWLADLYTPENIKEIILAASFVLAAWVFGRLISLLLNKVIHAKAGKTIARLCSAFYPILAPTLAILFFSVGTIAAEELVRKPVLLPIISQFCLVWLVLDVVQIVTKSKAAWWFVAVVVSTIVVLNIFGWLAPVEKVLDSYAFSFGKYHISVLKIIKLIIALVFLLWLTGSMKRSGETYIERIPDLTLRHKILITRAFQVILYFTIFLISMNILGIDLTALAVFSGAVGVGIGLGLQKVASNFISGVLLLFEDSIKLGDIVEISGGITGTIKQSTSRYTMIETADGREVMIPNEEFITQRVINWTLTNARGRVEIKVGVSYESDLERAQEIMLECARSHPKTSKETDPQCFLNEFADNSVNFTLFFWLDDIKSGKLGPQSDVMMAIWKRFKAENIEIPYPQRDVYIKNADFLQKK